MRSSALARRGVTAAALRTPSSVDRERARPHAPREPWEWQLHLYAHEPYSYAPMQRAAVLALEDGSAYWGEAFGDATNVGAEVVFNTSMTGYQEVSTDASYRGQIVCFTYPLIGNYGVFSRAAESRRPWAEAIIVREVNEPARAGVGS